MVHISFTNVVHSILCSNLLLLIMNHTIRPESGYEVASCLYYLLSLKSSIYFISERYSVNHGRALKMRPDNHCKSLLRLQENFATRSKPRVQATVAASCIDL